mgnify:FL=1
MIHARTLHALDFGEITAWLAGLCRTSAGRERARSLAPLPDAETASEAARLYEEAASWMERPLAEGGFHLAAFPDVGGLLHAVETRRGAAQPDAEAFWALREMLRQAQAARQSIAVPDAERQWPRLLALADAEPLPVQLTAALNRCISDDALIRDESSPALYQARVELRRLHQSCMRRVKDYAVQYNMLHYLQDEFMTLSSDRYVLPLKANFKGRMQGIIHDWSQTGETCYFEPLFLVEINNRLQELKREEREEERKVLAYLADLLRAELPGAHAALRLLAELDLLQAKRALAATIDGRCVPITAPAEGIQLLGARHPLLMLAPLLRGDAAESSRQCQARVRPLDIVLRPGERALIITGGNAGGKTVCLKTLGLIAAMTMSGLPVPAAGGSHLPWFSRLDAFIGDEQSLTGNLSTFTAQIQHLAKAWRHLGESGLVLLDEFGAGTDPAQGAALAQAVLDELIANRTFVLAATHFPSLKSYALTREHARAASVLFDPASKKPLYRLAYDHVGASQALDVAREYGLPESILRRAERYLLQDGGDTSALLARLNALAAQREREIQELRAQQARAKQRLEHEKDGLRRERQRLHDEVRAQAAELMRAVREGKAGHKQALRELSRLRGTLAGDLRPEEASVLPLVEHFAPGQSVLHLTFNKRGVVTDVDERRSRVRVDLNGVSLWASMRDVRLADARALPAAQRGGPVSPVLAAVRENAAPDRPAAAEDRDASPLRLDVRGQRAELAEADVEKFLDRALLAGIGEVEIVHGRGTGALRRRIHEFLRAFPAAASFATAPEDRGGDGMTVVLLR